MITPESSVKFVGLDNLENYLVSILTIINTAKKDIDALDPVEISASCEPDNETLQGFQTILYSKIQSALKEPLELSLEKLKESVNTILSVYGASPIL